MGRRFCFNIDESKSIVDGRFLDFYKQNLFTIQNSHKTLAPIAEPIGAPLIFAPLIAIFGVNLCMLKYVMLMFYIGIAIALWECLSLFKTITHIFKTCTLFFVLSYYEFSFLLETVNSDLPFTFFICTSILYFLKYSMIGREIYLLLAILCGAFSYFIRDAGAAICGAFFFLGIWEFLIYKNWRKVLLYVFPLASILIFKLVFPPFKSNLFDDLISKITYERCIQPIYLIYENVSKNILPLNRLYNFSFLFIVVWMIIVTGLFSFYKSQKKKINFFISLFLMFYVLIHVFAGAIEERYFLIIQIIMLLFFLFGLYLILARFKLTEKLILTFFTVVTIEAAAKDLVKIKNWCFTENYTFRNEVETTEALKTWSFIKKNTLPNDIVFFRKPTVLRLFTSRNSCVFLEDSIFVNRPNINFYQLDASCGNVKNHLQNVMLKRDTIFTEGKFQLIRLTPLNAKP